MKYYVDLGGFGGAAERARRKVEVGLLSVKVVIVPRMRVYRLRAHQGSIGNCPIAVWGPILASDGAGNGGRPCGAQRCSATPTLSIWVATLRPCRSPFRTGTDQCFEEGHCRDIID